MEAGRQEKYRVEATSPMGVAMAMVVEAIMGIMDLLPNFRAKARIFARGVTRRLR